MHKAEKEIVKRNLAVLFESAEKDKLDSIFKCLVPRERKILEYRYKYGMCWEFIPEKVGFSRMQCFRIHDKALERIQNFL